MRNFAISGVGLSFCALVFALPALADVAPLEARLMACLDAVEAQDVSGLDERGASFFGGEVVTSNGHVGDQSISRILSVTETRFSQRLTLTFVRYPRTPEFEASASCVVYIQPEDVDVDVAAYALRTEIVQRYGDIREAEPGVSIEIHYETCREKGGAIRVVESLIGTDTSIFIGDRPWIETQCPGNGE